MKKYSILLIGIFCMIASFIWMVLSQSATGPFLILGSISGAIIMEGIHRIKDK
jgi:multisubunit Na+/H+ antiporter MnhE subunit